ncbi:MAG: ferredoxin [Candidatus Shapirobacteria bacterium]|nr:ferredoxin [Candidatus Shapirobacteria bacterium]
MNNKLKIFLPILLLSSSAFILFKFKKDSTITNTSSDSQNLNSTNSTDEISTSIPFQKLTIISNRCRGCGRCVQIDPAHFEMVGNIAKVISSTDLNSSNLTMAVNSCPSQAIVIE